MDTNRKVFRNSSPTLGAELRGVFGWDFNDCSGSFRRFPAQYIEEPEPSTIPHRLIECSSAIPGVHLLNTDGIIESNQLISKLEMKISSLVSDFLVGFSNQQASFLPLLRPLNSSGKPLLAHCQYILRLLKEAGISYLHTVGCCQERLQANINTDRFVSRCQWFKWNAITGKTSKPFTCRRPADCDSFYGSFNQARKPQLKSADIPDDKVFAIELPTSLFQGKGVIPIPAFKPGKADFTIAISEAIKETLKGSLQTLKYLLEYLRAYILIFGESCFKFRQLFNLTKVGQRTVVASVGNYTLLEGTVVKLTAQRKPILSSVDSLSTGLDPILKSLSSLHNSL